MSSLAIYLIGFVIVILGLAYGAFLAGAPPQWIIVGAVIALGIGVLAGVTTMRQKDAGG
jgi:hypothetical protein